MKLFRSLLHMAMLAIVPVSILGFPASQAWGQSKPIPQSSEIRLGMSTALSGLNAGTGTSMKFGVEAALHEANQNGGIRGRSLRLIALDDGYEPSQAVANIHQLIDRENVLAIIGNVGTPTTIAVLPIINEKQTLYYAAYTGSDILRKNPPERYVINYRASYAEEISEMINALIKKGGIEAEDIAFFTQKDFFGDSCLQEALQHLAKLGVKKQNRILRVSYERNSEAVEGALASLLMAPREPKAVIMVGAYAPCTKLIKLAQESNFKPLFLSVSFIGSQTVSKKLGNTPVKLIVTQVTPSPDNSSLPVVKSYHNAIKSLNPASIPDYTSLEGYISTIIFLKALSRIEGEPTRENIIESLLSLGKFDMGADAPLALSSSDHQASHTVWPTLYKEGRFVPFTWDEIPALLKKTSKP